MKKKNIFLSYRRDDNPGYVSKLEHDLEQAFGHGRVFRDIDDIKGGTKWKDVLQQNLENAGALLVIIGPRWEAIWNERDDHISDYIVYELEKARELGVPIIPVTLNGAKLSSSLDLGPIDWLLDNQMYDISDHQGRWSTDLDGLIDILKQYVDDKKPIWKYVTLATVVLIVLLLFLLPDRPDPEPAINVPDIAGNWVRNDGTRFVVEQFPDSTFKIESSGYGSGHGEFIPNMPNKFRVTVQGRGYGEYSVSRDGQRIVGWFTKEGTSQQRYGTLTRVE